MSRSITVLLAMLATLWLLSGCTEDEDTRDFDNDGLLNAAEYREGTEERNPDTDGDGLQDGEEVHVHGTDPTRVDTDGDSVDDRTELLNGTDPLVADAPDEDGEGPAPDDDADNDGLSDDEETETYETDPSDGDSDGDGRTDYAEVKVSVWKDNGSAVGTTDPNDPDSDGDGHQDNTDNCPLDANGGQPDTDGDGIGDACDADDDNDQMPDTWENANGLNPLSDADAGQDADGDGLTNFQEYDHQIQDWSLSFLDYHTDRASLDPQDSDTDGDGYADAVDVCPSIADPDQTNTDGDAYGDACDADDDGDGMADQWELDYGLDPLDPADAAVNGDADAWNNLQEFDVRLTWRYRTTDPALDDSDSDSVRDDMDNCPATANADQANDDGDDFGDACDSDRDDDGMPDWWEDKHGFDPMVDDSGADADGDGLTNLEEYQLGTHPLQADSDSDTVNDDVDNCPTDPNQQQIDQDSDGAGDVCDSDRDGDGISNHQEYIDGTDPDDLLGAPAKTGVTVYDPGSSFDINRASVALQSDGKIVVAGGRVDADGVLPHQIFVARFNAGGSLDSEFDGNSGVANGVVLTSSPDQFKRAQDIIQLASGQLLVVGTWSGDVALLRYNNDGTMDETFGVGDSVSYSGVASVDLGSSADEAMAVVEQDDGKLVVVGETYNSFKPGNDFFIARFMPDGTLDSSFGSGGVTYSSAGYDSESFSSVSLQDDGKIVAAGTGTYSSSPVDGSDFVVARYTANGQLDVGFDGDSGSGNGIVSTKISAAYDVLSAAHVLADGKIVAGGASENVFSLTKYNADGTLDAGFDGDAGTGDGIVVTSYGSIVPTDFIVQSDGRLILVGERNLDAVLLRALGDGSIDTSYGVNGIAHFDVMTSENFLYSAVERPLYGDVVSAGLVDDGSYFDLFVSRNDQDGTLDTTFGDSP